MTLVVSLGPDRECHPGFHGALVETPPSGVAYETSSAEHLFVWPEARGVPFVTPDIGELVYFGPNAAVHAARWPVCGASAWIADMDDFAYPMFCGRFGFTQRFTEIESSTTLRSEWFANVLHQRMVNMIVAFGHTSCKRLFFRSAHQRARAIEWLCHLGMSAEAEPVMAKMDVLYPALPLDADGGSSRKWQGHPAEVQIVFCGRDWHKKNGALARRVMERLVNDYEHVRCVFIGEAPAAGFRHPRYEQTGVLPRHEVLKVFQESHVLFHPAHSETFGIVFAEAAAHALAVVAASGDGMEHVGEFLTDGKNALLVRRTRRMPLHDQEAQFERALRLLLDDPELLHACGMRNLGLATDGVLSMSRRDRTLTAAYASFTGAPGPALTPRLLPCGRALTTVTARRMSALIDDFLARTGRTALYARLSIDLDRDPRRSSFR